MMSSRWNDLDNCDRCHHAPQGRVGGADIQCVLKRTKIHLLASLFMAILGWIGLVAAPTTPSQASGATATKTVAQATKPTVAVGAKTSVDSATGSAASAASTQTHGSSPSASPTKNTTPGRTTKTTTVTSVTNLATVQSVSGLAMPSGNITGWKQVFADDFSGPYLSSKWFAYGGQPGGDPGGYWSPSHVNLVNGQLVLRGYRDSRFSNKFVTGGVSTAHGFVQTYGKYLVRFRMDAGAGIAHAIMLWPADNSWPPEIDFSEDNGAAPRAVVTSTLHYTSPTKFDYMVHRTTEVDFSQWHTLGVEWLPGQVTYTLDGVQWATVSDSHVPSIPMAIAMQTQAWSCGTNTWETCPDSTTPAEVDLDVDWVVAYSPAS